MRIILFVILFQAVSTLGYSQFIQDKHHQKNVLLTGTLFTFLIFIIHTLMLLMKDDFINRINVNHIGQLKFSGGKMLTPLERSLRDGKGYTFRITPKYRTGDNKATYQGFSLYYVSNQYDTKARYDNSIEYQVNSKIVGLDYVLGAQTSYKHWFLECSSGLGVIYWNISNTLDKPVSNYWGIIPLIYKPQEDGNHFKLNIPLKTENFGDFK